MEINNLNREYNMSNKRARFEDQRMADARRTLDEERMAHRFFSQWRPTTSYAPPPSFFSTMLVPNPQIALMNSNVAGFNPNAPAQQAQFAPAMTRVDMPLTPQVATNEEAQEDETVEEMPIVEEMPTEEEAKLDEVPMGDLDEYDTFTGNLFGSGVSGRRRAIPRRRMFY